MSEEATVIGIEDTKAVLKLVITAVNAIETAKADGKIDMNDLGVVLTLIPTVGPALSGLKGLKTELTDLTAEEVAELTAFVMGELKIQDAKATAVLEKSLKLIAAIVELVVAIKA